MAQTGFTPISLYYTTTASAAPTAGNLVAGELAINTQDGVLYYKDSSGVVQSIASKAGNSGSFTNLAYTGTLTGGTGVVNLGSGQFYKDASGNVGIGTSSPVSNFQIANSTAPQIVLTNSGVSSFSLGTTSGYSSIGTDAAAITFKTGVSTGSLFTTGTERMRIDSSGNLLVGTTTAIAGIKLNVSGGINSANGALNVSGNGGFYNSSNKFGVDNNAGATRFYSSGSNSSTRGSYEFHITDSVGSLDTVAAVIDSSGNLLVGTTSVNNGAKVSVLTGGLGQSFFRTDATAFSPLAFYSNTNTLQGYITCTGAGVTAYITSSDYRLKENIEPMTGSLDKVSALKPVTYTWKANGSDGQGFIAHELQAICPDAVYGEKDAVNEDGSIKPQGIDTSFLIATLVSAIQEQQAMIENLTIRLNALEGK